MRVVSLDLSVDGHVGSFEQLQSLDLASVCVHAVLAKWPWLDSENEMKNTRGS